MNNLTNNLPLPSFRLLAAAPMIGVSVYIIIRLSEFARSL